VRFWKENGQKQKKNEGVNLSRWGVNSNSNLGPSGIFWKLGCLRRKQLGGKLLHVVEKWFSGLPWLP